MSARNEDVKSILLRNAAVLDGAAAEIHRGCDVLIERDLIREVSNRPLIADYADVVDLGGRILMPGLIDSHVHVMAATTDLAALARMPPALVAARASVTLRDMLHRGFTSVRDAGGAEWGLAEAVRLGYFEGPRLFTSGLALAQTGGQGDFRSREEASMGCPSCHGFRTISRVADGVDAVRLAAREELRKGATQLKIMAGGGFAGAVPIDRSHFSMEELRAAVAEAASANTYVMAHAYAATSIRRAVDAGARTIEHGNFIDAQTAALMAGRVFMVPTLAVHEAQAKHAHEVGFDDETVERIRAAHAAGLQALDTCHAAGVKLGLGSDLEGILHPYQLREFELRLEVLTPAEVIASATVIGAEILQMEGRLGVVAEGAFADLLVLNRNPLTDLSTLNGSGQAMPIIMQGGRFIRHELNR